MEDPSRAALLECVRLVLQHRDPSALSPDSPFLPSLSRQSSSPFPDAQSESRFHLGSSFQSASSPTSTSSPVSITLEVEYTGTVLEQWCFSLQAYSSGEGKAKSASQTFRKLCVFVRSIQSLCSLLPANAVAGRVNCRVHQESHQQQSVAWSGNSLDRMSFQLSAGTKKSDSALEVKVIYISDVSTVVSKDGKKASGIGRLFTGRKGQLVMDEQDHGEGQGEADEDAVEEAVEDHDDVETHNEVVRGSSGPRPIPQKNSRQHTPDTVRHVVHSLPIVGGRKGSYGLTRSVSRGGKSSSFGRKSLVANPFKTPGTPPLYPSSVLLTRKSMQQQQSQTLYHQQQLHTQHTNHRTHLQAAASSSSSFSSVFAFGPDGSLESQHSASSGSRYAPHSLPATFVTLPSGSVYRSPTDASLASLTASLVSSVQLFYGNKGPDMVPPFAVFSSGSKTLTASTLSSTSSSRHTSSTPPVEWGRTNSPVFSSLAGALNANPPLQSRLYHNETILSYPKVKETSDGIKLHPFKQRKALKREPVSASSSEPASPQLAGLNFHLATDALEMPWFIGEDSVDEMADAFLRDADTMLTEQGAADLSSPEGASEDLAQFMRMCDLTMAQLGLRKKQQQTTSLRHLRAELQGLQRAYVEGG